MNFFKNPIYKSRTSIKIDGVCAGLAKAIDIDPSWMRLIFIILFACGGSGILIYIVLIIVLDREPEDYIE